MAEERVFKSRGPRMIYVPRLGQRIRFDANGEYSTSDANIIAVLEKHRSIVHDDEPQEVPAEEVPAEETVEEPVEEPTEGEEVEAEAIPEETTTEDAERVNPDSMSRPDLDHLAKASGLNPEDYPNKEAVAAAINEARGV